MKTKTNYILIKKNSFNKIVSYDFDESFNMKKKKEPNGSFFIGFFSV